MTSLIDGALSLRDMTVQLGGRTIIDGASTVFVKGAAHAVIGRSGAGKSVLLKAATGLLPLTSGEVQLGSVVASGVDAGAFSALRQRVVFVHQDPALLDDLNVLDNIRFPLSRRGVAPREQSARLERWLTALQLVDVLSARPSALPPGRLRQVALCRALCLQPEFLVVDEPTTGLDPESAREVDAALSRLGQMGSTLITITHDLRALAGLRPTLHWIDRGKVLYTGPYADSPSTRPAPLRALLAGGSPPQAGC